MAGSTGAARALNDAAAPPVHDHLPHLLRGLGALALHLKMLDNSSAVGAGQWTASQVGTCPYCGYPSLGSGMCAFCRPQLVR